MWGQTLHAGSTHGTSPGWGQFSVPRKGTKAHPSWCGCIFWHVCPLDVGCPSGGAGQRPPMSCRPWGHCSGLVTPPIHGCPQGSLADLTRVSPASKHQSGANGDILVSPIPVSPIPVSPIPSLEQATCLQEPCDGARSCWALGSDAEQLSDGCWCSMEYSLGSVEGRGSPCHPIAGHLLAQLADSQALCPLFARSPAPPVSFPASPAQPFPFTCRILI